MPIFKAILLIALYSHLSGASLAALSQISRLQTDGDPYLNQIMLRMNKLQHKIERESLGINALQNQLVQLEIRVAELQSDFRKKNLKTKVSTLAVIRTSDISVTSPVSEIQEKAILVQDTDSSKQITAHPLIHQVWMFISIQGLYFAVGVILVAIMLSLVFRRSQKLSHCVDTSQTRPDNKTNTADVSIESKREIHKIFMDAKRLVKQGNDDQAIQLLETQLIVGNNPAILWKLLFEILQSKGMKTEFRKLALRFKRLGKHKNLWAVIQKLGHQLEPDNLLYLSEKERIATFFKINQA